MAVIKDSKHKDEARKFMEFLKTPQAAKVFAQYKFRPLAGNR